MWFGNEKDLLVIGTPCLRRLCIFGLLHYSHGFVLFHAMLAVLSYPMFAGIIDTDINSVELSLHLQAARDASLTQGVTCSRGKRCHASI
jgi:hypothetical protein